MTKTIVVLSSGDGTGISFTRCLQACDGYSTVGINVTIEDHLLSETTKSHLVVGPEEPGFVGRVNAIARSVDADLIYAADTGAVLDAIFEHRARLVAPVFLPDPDAVTCEDKWLTHLMLRDAGIRVPETELVFTPSDVDSFMSRVRPVWLRRTKGSGGAGSIATTEPAFAKEWINHHDGWGCFTIAAQLGRRNTTWTALWHEGTLQMSQLRERLLWKYNHLAPSGVTGITGIQRTIWDPGLHELALETVAATVSRPHAIISVDITWDLEGRPCPTEVQTSRFFTSIDFLAAVGANFPLMYCDLGTGGTPRADPLVNPAGAGHYWIRAVDRFPTLMEAGEFESIDV